MLDFLMKHYDKLALSLLQHLEIVLLALVVSMAFAIPVGLLLSRKKWISNLVLGIFSILYSIPSLALFSFFLPVTGLGVKTAVIVVAIYVQFILLRNTVAGFTSVDASIIEASRGMGLNAYKMFFEIELPLALPVIIAGLRIAAVSAIGLATIAATIHAGGIGTLLFEGLRNLYPVKIFWGILLSSGLSMAANQVLMHFEKSSLKKARGEIAKDKKHDKLANFDPGI